MEDIAALSERKNENGNSKNINTRLTDEEEKEGIAC